eukprot:7229247-Pyramimonas_sp.AAC.1
MVGWYQDRGVPRNCRINHLSSGMLGSATNPEFKAKAAETGVLLPWALSVCERYKDILDHGA